MTRKNDLPRRAYLRPTLTRLAGMKPKSFRVLVLGFCFTLLIAGGSGPALALWSQNASMTMQVKAGILPSPDLECADVPNETAVLVTWTPQRAGVTGYDVTVTRNGLTIKSSSYSSSVTSERVTPPPLGAGDYAYSVTVTAKYGSWQAQPTAWDTIRARVAIIALGSMATISCS
ncbi:hypothetical protein C3B78_15310 [Arthrobacter sp. PGP41]|uniref:hypothetical protein n=1 Tax=Arthrobacter sp. PGP41 TaxID=2079227 RepID=UPI000CDBE723|nr:hypothetical protein [Arthrobacter sp. PGP41]AUZ35679.1 hypothetical protein C3B78_15310 [Arthrobacter sp. PGP41]